MICQTNYFISTSSPKLRIFSAACAVCVFEDILWILLRIQIKAQYCGCISPGVAIHALNVLPVGEHFSLFFSVYHTVCCISFNAISAAGTSDCSDVWDCHIFLGDKSAPWITQSPCDDMALIVRRVGWWHWNTDGACLFEIFCFKLPSPGQSSLPVSQHPASPTETRLFHTGKSGPVNWQSWLGSAHTPSTPPPQIPPLNRH